MICKQYLTRRPRVYKKQQQKKVRGGSEGKSPSSSPTFWHNHVKKVLDKKGPWPTYTNSQDEKRRKGNMKKRNPTAVGRRREEKQKKKNTKRVRTSRKQKGI